jgi:hypothetical protein
MKTPEELAEEWIEINGWNTEPFRDEYTIEFKKQGYVAGYQAAKESNSPVKPDGSNSSNNSNGWISVKDRLPEINNRMSEDVLMLDEYKQMSVKPFEIVHNKIVVDWGEAGIRPLSEFTHWMPLPKPPEE